MPGSKNPKAQNFPLFIGHKVLEDSSWAGFDMQWLQKGVLPEGEMLVNLISLRKAEVGSILAVLLKGNGMWASERKQRLRVNFPPVANLAG